MSIIDKLLGRRKRTAPVIADEIANQRSVIAAGRARIEGAQADRKAAIESLDAARHKAADETIAEANREIERHEHAIGVLEAAHADQVAVETRQTFEHEVDEAARESAALSQRIQAEYEPAAAALAAIARDLRAHHAKRGLLEARAGELGLLLDIERPESFRRGEAAAPPLTLAQAIGNLPALYAEEPDIHPAPLSEHVRALRNPELLLRRKA